ncbi:hypothetical protein BH11BAC2_BH11BAC2_15400 [soil metagenome]
METKETHLENLSEIRSLMERSSRFISLSGLSGIFAGFFALLGVVVAYRYLDLNITAAAYYKSAISENGMLNSTVLLFFFKDAVCVLMASLFTIGFLTRRNSRLKNVKIWDATAKRLLINLMLPLVAGGIFCLTLIAHGCIALIAPSTLIFYGLALLNASKYTFNDIRYLGVLEILLGLLASLFIDYGLLFWAAGFGVLHIIYGTSMYLKYEK